MGGDGSNQTAAIYVNIQHSYNMTWEFSSADPAVDSVGGSVPFPRPGLPNYNTMFGFGLKTYVYL